MLGHPHRRSALAHDHGNFLDAQVGDDPKEHDVGLVGPQEPDNLRDRAPAKWARASTVAAGSSGAATPSRRSWSTVSGRRVRPRRTFARRRRPIVNTNARNSSSSPEKPGSKRATSNQTWDAMSSASCGSRARRYRNKPG